MDILMNIYNNILFIIFVVIIFAIIILIWIYKIKSLITRFTLAILILSMIIAVNFSKYKITNNIIIFKIQNNNDNMTHIIFVKDINSSKLRFILEKNYTAFSISNVFETTFKKSIEDYSPKIEGPYVFNNINNVYYVTLEASKPLLSGTERSDKSIRFKTIEELKTAYKDEDGLYDKDILNLLFELNTDFLK